MTTYKGVALYNCSDGYDLVGVVNRACQANANWSGEEPTCRGNWLF